MMRQFVTVKNINYYKKNNNNNNNNNIEIKQEKKQDIQEDNNCRTIITQYSVSKNWENIDKEWMLNFFYIDKSERSKCICGKDTKECFIVYNKSKNKDCYMCNKCFSQLSISSSISKECIESLKVLQDNHKENICHKSLINIAQQLDCIKKKDAEYYLLPSNINLSDWKENKIRINKLICMAFNENRPKCHCKLWTIPRQNIYTKGYFYSCIKWSKGGCKYPKKQNEEK